MTNTATLNFDTLYLSDAGQYSCQVILTSSKLEGQHTVAAHYSIEFMSKFNLLSEVLLCVVFLEFLYVHVIPQWRIQRKVHGWGPPFEVNF